MTRETDHDRTASDHAQIEALMRDEVAALSADLAKLSGQMTHLTSLYDEALRRLAVVPRLAARRGRGLTPGVLNEARIVASSRLFSASHYRALGGGGSNRLESALHYVRFGAFEGLDPGPDFSTLGHYAANPAALDQGVPALVHFLGMPSGDGATVS